MDDIEIRVPFNQLVDFVYYKTAKIGEGNSPNQVWWDPGNGSFYVWNGNQNSCFPWVEVDLPGDPSIRIIPEAVFPTNQEFLEEEATVPVGTIVQIASVVGLNGQSKIAGISKELQGLGSIVISKDQSGAYWNIVELFYPNPSEFGRDAEILPFYSPVRIRNAKTLGSPFLGVKVENLGFEIDKEVEVTLIKNERSDFWSIVPSSSLKFVGRTRLFPGTGEAPDGEIIQEGDRVSVYYYNRWEYVLGEWVLQGDWVDINTGLSTSPPSSVVNYGSVVVYCDGVTMASGESRSTDHYSFSYTVDTNTGELVFSYSALDTAGAAILPKVEISDSINGAFRYDISEYVFGGRVYRMFPSLADTMTPLRVYREHPLMAVDGDYDQGSGEVANPFLVGRNLGPSTSGWNKYSILLPLNYERRGKEWSRATKLCQGFGTNTGDTESVHMVPSVNSSEVKIYEELLLRSEDPSRYSYVYQEPYLFSGMQSAGDSYDAPWQNSAILPGGKRIGNWEPSRIEEYDPLANRKVVTEEDGYGLWAGNYCKVFRCNDLSRFFFRDTLDGNIEILEQPIWDSSIYRYPQIVSSEDPSYGADPNDFNIQYGLFVAGNSVAGDCVFDVYDPLSLPIDENEPPEPSPTARGAYLRGGVSLTTQTPFAAAVAPGRSLSIQVAVSGSLPSVPASAPGASLGDSVSFVGGGVSVIVQGPPGASLEISVYLLPGNAKGAAVAPGRSFSVGAAIAGGGASANSPWTPAAISTALWLDAADSGTISLNGSNVSQWNDKSGNGYHMLQGTATNQPTYTDIGGGLSVLTFGGNDAMGTAGAAPLPLSTHSFFVVFRQLVEDDYNGVFIAAPSSGNDYEQTTAKTWTCAPEGGVGFTSAGSTGISYRLNAPSDSGIADLAVYSEVVGGTTGVMYKNGTQSSTDTSFTAFAATSTGPVIIGARGNGGVIGYSSNMLDGDIREIVYLGSAASTELRQTIEGYLSHKWGLTANLPGGHPYKTNPPLL
jgi:hypothetical protein